MSLTVAITCPLCNGASADHRLPPCDVCHNQGHLHVNREPDGTVPTRIHFASTDEWYDVREWHPPMLPDAAPNPLTLTYQRCIP